MAETLQQIIQKKLRESQLGTGSSVQQIIQRKISETKPGYVAPPAPTVNYRQGAVPYSTLPTTRPGQAPTPQPPTALQRVGQYISPQATGKVRATDIIRELPDAAIQTFSWPIKKLMNFAGKSSAHALNALATLIPVETLTKAIAGQDENLKTTADIYKEAAKNWEQRAQRIGNVFTEGGKGLGVYDEDAWNKLAEPLAIDVIDKKKNILERTSALASLIDVGVMRVFADPLWLGVGKGVAMTKELTLGKQAVSEQNALRTLGLNQGATAEEINAAFRARAKTFHPDTLFAKLKRNPTEQELLNTQKLFSDAVAARNTLIAKFKGTPKPTIERTQPTAQPAATIVPIVREAALPAGVSAKPVIPPVPTGVAFQIPNQTKVAELTKNKDILQAALEKRRAIIESGRTTPQAKKEFQLLSTLVENLNKKISDLSGQQNKISGPAVTKEQQAAMTRQPAPAPVSPTRQIIFAEVKTPKTVEIKAPIKPQVVGATIAKGKPITVRQQAQIKRDDRLTKKQEEEKLTKMVAEERAKNLAKPKSYREMLAIANAKKEAAKQVETKAKTKTIREYLLEKKIKEMQKAGAMTNEQAAKARAKGKVNLRTNEIEFKKTKSSIDTAEDLGTLKSDKDFKLFEHGYRLVKKYTKKTQGVVSEKNVPRGAAGAAYKSGTTRFKSLNNISAIVHEVTHIIDRGNNWRSKITEKGVIKELENIYKKYYLEKPDLKTIETGKAIPEGLATFIERYSLFPTKTKSEYPALYREFLGENGLYHDPLFNELVDDTQSILKQYQGLDALGKFMARTVDDARNVDVKSFYGVTDKLKAYFFNTGWILEKAGQYTGLERTSNDPYLWLETYRLWNQAFAHNVTSTKGRFKKETYLTLQGNGDFKETHNFNWGSIIHSLGSETNVSKYGGYLFARDTYFNYKELDNLNKTIATNKAKIKELEQEHESTRNEEIKTDIAKIKAVNDELVSYATQKKGMLEKRNIPQGLADEAYNLNKEIYAPQDKMFDALVRENLDTLYLAKLVKPELYNYLKGRQGYAPTYMDYIDEIAGTPELSDTLLDNPSFTIRGKEVKSLVARVGSEKAVRNPLLQAIINEGKNIPKAIQQIVYNKFGEIAGQLPDYAVNEVEYNPLMKDRNNTVIAIDDLFKKHAFKVDKNLKRLFDTAFTPKTMSVFGKVLAKSSKLFTASTTGIYSAFAIVNIPIDSVSAFIQSKNRLIPILDSFKKSIELLEKNAEIRKYVDEYFDLMGFRNTAIGSIYYAQTLADSLKLIDSNYKKSIGGQLESGLDTAIDVLSFPSQASEILTRLTEYVNSRQAGNPQIVAREDSTRVSAPFVHRGYIYPLIQPAVYVNAGLQVLDMTFNSMNRMWREFKGTKNEKDRTNVIGRFGLITAGLTAIALAEIGILLNKLKNAKTDEEKSNAQKAIDDYNNQSIYERSNFLRSSILADKPNILRIPANYAVISNLITILAADAYLNSNFTVKEYAGMFSESLPLPQAWTGFLPYFPKQIALISLGFKDFPQLKQLEADYMKNIPSEERYYATTPEFAKWLGDNWLAKKLDLSPIKINEFVNMFGRGIYKQFFGEWDSTKNPVVNIYNSMAATWKNAIFKKDYLFIGREFEKFYVDRDKLSYELTTGKKTFQVVQDKNLKDELIGKMQRSQLYSNVSDYMTKLRNIDSAGITVPKEYINSFYNIVSQLNRNNDKEALKSLIQLNSNSGFINFIVNSSRKLEEQKQERIKTKFEKEQSRGNWLGINVANAAELSKNLPKRELSSSPFANAVRAPIIITTRTGRQNLSKSKKAVLTVYNPEPSQTDASPHIGGFMTKMKFGDVAIGNRDEYNKARNLFFKEGKDTFIKIPELEKIKTPYGNGVFRVRDTFALKHDKKNKIDIFIPEKGSTEELMVRRMPSATYSYL